MNRLKQVTFNDSSNIQYTYDAAGRATNIYDSISGSIARVYNDYGCSSCSGRGLDLISQEITPLSTISYTYDADGRRSSMTVAGEPVVNYTYDDAGRLTNLSRVIGSGSRTYTLGYDNAGRRASIQIPLANGTDYINTAYGYDNANRLLSMIQQGPSALIEYLVYGYDANGNRTSFGRNTTQTLSPSVSGTSHDNANEMLAYNSKNLVYDANGNLQTRTDVCGTTTYTWDARNRLTGINGYKPDCSALTASFIYDAINRRISKTINGTTMQFVYDGRDIIQEIKAGVKTNYVRTLNLDEPLTRITGSTVRHYLKDALGSVMALADDTGATKTTYVYDAFGNVTASGETSDNPFQYTGRENDGTGLYYYRARYYSPEMQRFISEDPIRLKGGINFYSYTRNNPVNWRDPLGLFQVGIVSNIGGFDFSAVLYDSKSGWLPPQPPIDIRISTSILGAALTIRTDNEKTPCDKLYGNTSLETTWGINRFFGISYDPAMTHTTYNIGAGVATPILSYSGSVSGFATSVGNAISSLFGN